MPTVPQDALATVRALLAAADEKVSRLRSIDPYFIDLSLRENPFGSSVGQTLAQKLSILPQLRAFGFKNILLGTLDYYLPGELEVDDDFMAELQARGTDMTGGFAFTDIGRASAGGFTPSPSQVKLQRYGVPNTLHEIYLSKVGLESAGYDLATVLESLPPSIRWLQDHVRGDGGGPPRVIINVVDGCDAFAEDPDTTCRVLQLLAQQPITGLSLEDDRGTYLPFQVGAFIASARALLPAPQFKLLVHVHSGAGFENASVIEALLQGADGVWGGLPKRAAIIGHASLGELIANLVRVGNPNMQAYDVARLLPLATSLQLGDDVGPIPEDLPILGTNAYRMTLEFFRQTSARPMDLPAAAIGGTDGYRVSPLGSNEPILAGRLAEVLGPPGTPFPEAVLTQMIVLMRRELRAGERIAYDDPEQLVQLYIRAGGTP